MRRIATCLGLAAAMGLLVLATAAQADDEDEKVPLSQVPAKVTQALKAKYPRAQVLTAGKGDQDGTKVYEFELKEGDAKWEAAFTPDGKFAGSEEVIKDAALPAAVRKAFHAKYPGANVEEIEKAITVEGSLEKVVYEFIMKTAQGKLEAQFDPTGKFLSSEDPASEEKDEKKPQ
jgi:hypothetical protein